MTQTATAQDRYLSAFRELDENEFRGSAEWLKDLRKRAMERFQETGFPTARRGNEPYKYTNVAPIAETAFSYADAEAPRDLAEIDGRLPRAEGWRTAVFVNGRFVAGLSSGPDDMAVAGLQALAGVGEPLAGQHLGQYASIDEDPFIALNTALWRDGALVRLADEQVIDAPIHLVYATLDGASPVASHPRTLVIAGPHSKATVIETYIGPAGAAYFTNPVTEIELEDGAQVDHYRVLLDSASAYHVGATRVDVGRDASFSSMSFAAGGGLARHDLKVVMGEPGGETHLNGLYVTSSTQHIDNYINVDHAAPHATSRLYYKGILDEQSRAVFGGMVLVRPGADKTDSHQEDKNLLLSDEAEVSSKPSLEIYADDVKCGHGATAGAVAEDALFYMQSRGLDERTANLFLVRGFAAEILDTIKVDALREHLDTLTMLSIPRFQQENGA